MAITRTFYLAGKAHYGITVTVHLSFDCERAYLNTKFISQG